MFSALAGLINRRAWRVLVAALVITAVAAALGVHVREYLKPRGFDVADSGSAKARQIIEQASGTDPASSVLALVRLNDPVDTPSSRSKVAVVESKLHRDPAVVAVLDARSAHNPAMISRDQHSVYIIAALRPLNDKQQEEAGSRLDSSTPSRATRGSPWAAARWRTTRSRRRSITISARRSFSPSRSSCCCPSSSSAGSWRACSRQSQAASPSSSASSSCAR